MLMEEALFILTFFCFSFIVHRSLYSGSVGKRCVGGGVDSHTASQ